jgi:hypothetical protein
MAGMATLASGGNVWWGLTFALVAAFLGEFFAVRFLCHADTHIDPPAFAVFVTWTIIALLSTTTLFSLSGVIPILVAVVVAVLGYVLFKTLQKAPHQPRAEEA